MSIRVDDLCQFCGKPGRAQPTEAAVYIATFGRKAPNAVSFACEECFHKLTAAYPALHWEEDLAAGIIRPIETKTARSIAAGR